MTTQKIVKSNDIVKSVRAVKNQQAAFGKIMDAIFSGPTTEYSIDAYEGVTNFPAQVDEMFSALDMFRNSKSKDADLATIRVMASRWVRTAHEGKKVSIKTGTKNEPKKLVLTLVDATTQAGSKTNASKSKADKADKKPVDMNGIKGQLQGALKAVQAFEGDTDVNLVELAKAINTAIAYIK